MFRYNKSEEGWSITEIMVSIVIMGILAAISVLSVIGVRAHGDKMELASETRGMKAAVTQHWVGNNRTYPAMLNNMPVKNTNAPVYTPTDTKVNLQYVVSDNRKTYCINGSKGKQTYYYNSNAGENKVSTPYTVATCK